MVPSLASKDFKVGRKRYLVLRKDPEKNDHWIVNCLSARRGDPDEFTSKSTKEIEEMIGEEQASRYKDVDEHKRQSLRKF